MNKLGKTALALVGVAAVAVVSSLVTIAVCGGGEHPDAAKAREWQRRKIDEMTKAKGGRTGAPAAAPKRSGRADRSLATFRDPKGNFTMKVPKGWVVSSGGFDLLHWIHACDPKKPELGVFVLLKTECLLMNRASKQFYWDKRGFGLYV